MENLSRESILRMVGLHDSAQFMRQVNAIQMTLEQQGSDMVAYWTEIRKDERQISLIAGRVSANETSIGQLQIQANAISLSVQSLSTTVNGDGTQGSGLVSRVSSLEITESSISQRVGVIEGDYVKEAEISLMVVKDSSGYISNASIKADNILFTFTQNANFISNNTTVMSIDNSGNLWIMGEYKGGSITENITVGTGTNKMYIKPNESNGADLVGYSGTTEVLKLGFVAGETGYSNITPSLSLSYYNNGSRLFISQLKPYYLSIKNETNNEEALLMANRLTLDGDVSATGYSVKSGNNVYTGVTQTVTVGSTTLTIKGGIITGVT